jgi:hypothetical protein
MVEMTPEPIDKGFVLTSLRHFIDGLELDFARFAAEFAAGQQWAEEGFNSPADWVRFNCHMNSNTAWNALTVGEQVDQLPETLVAMRSGDIGFAHVATMANTADKVKGFDETQLLPLAKEHSPGKFHYKALHYRHALDAKGYADEQERIVEQRSLHLSTAQDGCLLVNGVFDPVGGATVRSALEKLAKPMGEHDDRTRDQRLADAAVELAGGRKPATIQVTATVDTLKAMAGAAGGEMEFSMPLPAATVQRLACDSNVMRVILDAPSTVIDVGRSRRVVGAGLRKAMAVRDQHCQWPGCERPASMCDGHHLVHWVDGGETNLDNCILLCKRHHRMVHEGGWQMVRVDGRIMTVAPTINFGMPRAPD